MVAIVGAVIKETTKLDQRRYFLINRALIKKVIPKGKKIIPNKSEPSTVSN